MSRKLFVTGSTGFVGQHLSELAAAKGLMDWELQAVPRGLDLLSPASIDTALAAIAIPDAVIHLAGQTFVPQSVLDPTHTLHVNLLGTLNLLQALKRRGFTGTFLYVSSGDVYGQVPESELPIRESRLPQPRNPYAVSKVSAELLCLQWGYTEPWRIMVARPFNHIGAGQREAFVVADMARQLIRVSKGVQPPQLQVGDIDVTRDFLDVSDVLQAYLSLLDHGRTGEIYNVCSGVELRVRDLILQMASLSDVEIELVQSSARMRRAEQRRVAGCSQKIQHETGWKPSVSITETLQRVLSDWKSREP
ncbi:GDP-mannose 4,6-dehydratase [Pseudomonas sp.]|uniref:GDP-mannose 4,6-dehydratase n=1 Tax=Pseudomonas sp. TaxID=306 RepID=UPI0019DF9E9C|nr:GDP-mannose 4,6-dehydratase [Pseudomonas sp.]MBF0677170.1 GDP-mannose 4,6-dehydratase [Pseudomonas sp.]